MEVVGFSCSKEFVRKIFVFWRWNWKRSLTNKLKNILQTVLLIILNTYHGLINKKPRRLKYMNKVHFVSKGKIFKYLIIINRRRELSEIGKPVLIIQEQSFNFQYSASCLCQLNEQNPVFVILRDDSNTQVYLIVF